MVGLQEYFNFMELLQYPPMKSHTPLIFLFLFLLEVPSVSQPAVQDSALVSLIDETNRKIDRAVVSKDLEFLHKHYGEDFVFTHGTGLIDSKRSWLESVKKSKGYASRNHDSTVVELHKDVAIISGKLTVGRIEPAKDGTMKYSLRYVRVFALRKKNWEMISHRTTSEWHHN